MPPSFMVHQKALSKIMGRRDRADPRSRQEPAWISRDCAATTLSHRNDVPLAADAEASIEIRHSGSGAPVEDPGRQVRSAP
jgi:hypothetical protein